MVAIHMTWPGGQGQQQLRTLVSSLATSSLPRIPRSRLFSCTPMTVSTFPTVLTIAYADTERTLGRSGCLFNNNSLTHLFPLSLLHTNGRLYRTCTPLQGSLTVVWEHGATLRDSWSIDSSHELGRLAFGASLDYDAVSVPRIVLFYANSVVLSFPVV